MCTRGKYILILLLASIGVGIEISGTVTDAETGLPVAGVTVVSAGHSTSTDMSGRYIIRSLPPDARTVATSHIAYQPQTRPVVAIVDFRLFPLIETLPSIEIHSDRQINLLKVRDTGGMDTDALIAALPGLDIRSGADEKLSFRGSSDVLIVVDGHIMPADQLGNREINLLPQNIEKAEFYTENIPAKYSALSPSALLVLETGSSNLSGELTTASFDTYSLTAGWGMTDIVQISAWGRTTADDFPYIYSRTSSQPAEEFTRKNNDSKQVGLSIKPEFMKQIGNANLRSRMELSFGWLDEGMPGDLDHPTPEARRVMQNFSVFDITDLHLGLSNISLSVSHTRGQSSITSPMPWVYVPVDANHRTDMTELSIDADYSLKSWFNPQIGLSAATEGYSMTNNLNHDRDQDRVDRTNCRLYGQIPLEHRLFDMLRTSLNTGLAADFADRGTDFTEFGTELSPQIEAGLSGDIQGQIVGISSGYRESFRSPSFTDLYWQRDAFSEGNPDLAPEIGHSSHLRLYSDLGTERVKLYASVDFWESSTDSVIVWNRGFDGIYRPVNMGTELRTGQGHTLELSLLSTFFVTWNNTLIHSEHISGDRYLNGKELPFIPSYSERLTIALERWGGRIDFTARGHGREYTLAANTKWTEPYLLLDTGISYGHSYKDLRIMCSIEIKNITDTGYETMPGYPGMGRGWSISLGIMKGER